MKSAPRFREGPRNGSGVVPRAFTKTNRRPWEAGLGALLTLFASGCVGPNFLTELVTYEVQVRDGAGKFVEGARVVALPLTYGDGRSVEGRTDSRGRCAVGLRQSALWIPATSTGPTTWLSVTIEAEGQEPRRMDFLRDQFIDDGGELRRVEAVSLKRKLP